MHELSLAAEICRIAREAVGPARASRVTSVNVEVGADAGVEPANLEFCLGVLLHQPPFLNAEPRLTSIPGADLRVTHLEVDDDGPDH
jgi:Zn finger protein HypA/HybF involved in hydrogenase expression